MAFSFNRSQGLMMPARAGHPVCAGIFIGLTVPRDQYVVALDAEVTLGPLSYVSVSVGAAVGALLRWGLGIALNPVFPILPLGTLAANLCGGLLMGAAVEVFGTHANAPPEARLAVMTGFLGGFTTFSTFSAEVVNLLGRKQYAWSLFTVSAHVIGSIALTIVGLGLARILLAGAAT